MQTLRPDDFNRWRNAGQLALAPDGRRLAFVEMWPDAEKNVNRTAIFLVPTDGSAPARQITFGPKGDRSPKWSPDGRYLAFISARETEWRGDLYVLDLEAGGDARLAVTLPRGVAEFAWSADGKRFALTGRPPYPVEGDDPDEKRKSYAERIVHVERLHYRGDGAGIVDDEQPAVWVADVDRGEVTQLLDGDYPVASPRWAPDGRITFLSRREPDYELTWNDQVWAVPPDGGEPTRISDSPGRVYGYAFTDGGSLVCVAATVPGFAAGCHDDVLLIDGKPIELGPNVGKHVLSDTIDPIAGPSPTPTCVGDDVYVNVSEKGTVNVWRVREDAIEHVLVGSRVVGEFAVAGDVIAFTTTSPTDPASIRAASLDEADERTLHRPNPWLDDITVSEWREFWVEVDGVASQAWVMLPPGGIAGEAPPAIVNCHGGPHGAYGWAFNVLLQMMSADGRSVIFGNPPGSLSYGENFTQLTHRAWGEADFPHVMAYCDEAVEQGLADPDRLAIAGGSYGGFLTLWGVGHTDRFKAACAQRGVSDLTSIFASSEFGWALMHGCMGAHPWEDPELFRRLSPLTYAEAVDTPIRLIGCTVDHRVSMEQVEQMYIRLKVMRKHVDLVIFRDSHHLVYSGPPRNKVEHQRAINEWFERYL